MLLYDFMKKKERKNETRKEGDFEGMILRTEGTMLACMLPVMSGPAAISGS